MHGIIAVFILFLQSTEVKSLPKTENLSFKRLATRYNILVLVLYAYDNMTLIQMNKYGLKFCFLHEI